MPQSFYRRMVMMPATVTLTYADFRDLIQQQFATMDAVTLTEPADYQLQLQIEHWQFNIFWETEPHIVEESAEIARRFAAGRDDGDIIAACPQRITTAAAPDMDMRYFNYFVYVLEVLEAIRGVYHFDPDGLVLWKHGEDMPPAR